MVRWGTHIRNQAISIPHARGDGPDVFSLTFEGEEYSPRAWGWSAGYGCPCESERVFPTRVGMVRSWEQLARTCWGIPHARGDGPCGVTDKDTQLHGY